MCGREDSLPRAYRTEPWTKHTAEVTPRPRKGEKPRDPKHLMRKGQDMSALWSCAFFTSEKLCWGSLQWYKEDWKLLQTGSRRFGLFFCDEDWHSSGRNRFIPSAPLWFRGETKDKNAMHHPWQHDLQESNLNFCQWSIHTARSPCLLSWCTCLCLWPHWQSRVKVCIQGFTFCVFSFCGSWVTPFYYHYFEVGWGLFFDSLVSSL